MVLHAGVNTKICVKPFHLDSWISMSLFYEGSYEAGEVSVILKALEKYPTAVFLDIGCNIGTYTLVMAAAGREVVGVDAMLDNLAYIHTSLAISNTSHLVKLLHNPVRCMLCIQI